MRSRSGCGALCCLLLVSPLVSASAPSSGSEKAVPSVTRSKSSAETSTGLSDLLQSLKAELKLLREQLTASKRLVKTLQEQVASLQAESETASQQLTALRSSLADSRQFSASLDSSIDTLERQLVWARVIWGGVGAGVGVALGILLE